MRSAWEGVELLDLLHVEREVIKNKPNGVRYTGRFQYGLTPGQQANVSKFDTIVICVAGIMVGIQSDVSTSNANYAVVIKNVQCTLQAES